MRAVRLSAGLGLGLNIRIDEPANHALVLRVMLGRFRLEELSPRPWLVFAGKINCTIW